MLVMVSSLVLAMTINSVSLAPVSEAGSGIRITVNCTSNPERVTIKNNRSRRVLIQKVGSTYQPRPGEPYTVNRYLGSGKSITFTFGTAPGPNKLTSQFIFHNTEPTEKAKVILNIGTFTKRC